jgi:hypothetical protein
MAEAAKSARGSFNEIKSGAGEMGGHVSSNMFASRHAIMAVTESLGVQMPRAITALLVHIGPLGAALEAAFPFAAIALGAVLLIEHLAKLKEEGIKLTEDQMKFGTAVQLAFNSLDQKLISAGIRADELRNDHLGALHLQLQLIDKQSMAELVHSFAEVAAGADAVFADLKTSWYQFGIGSAGASHALTAFQNQYKSLLAQSRDGEASDLLAGTRKSAERVLELQKLAGSKMFTVDPNDKNLPSIAAGNAAVNELKKSGVGYTEKEVQAQQILVDALNAQLEIEGKVAALKKADGGNATATTGKELSGLKAEAAKQAAEHAQKMGELSLEIEREQANESNTINEASINERLMSDLRLAGEEYAILEQANAAKIAALDRTGKDYNNQLKGLQDKEEEITLQHTATLGGLLSKAREATARQEIQDLEQSERGKIEGTERGSRERLQAIDAALTEERAKGLQGTTFYRDLVNERIQVMREAADEASKAAAEAGKESAANEQKMGELLNAAEQQRIALRDSFHRVSIQMRLDEEIAAANDEFALKDKAMKDEAAALDRGGKDYDNKLKAIQDKERQLVQEHENQITAIKDKAVMDQNTKQQAAMTKLEEMTATGLSQVLMGHKSFASMMDGIGNEVVSGMLRTAIMSMMTADMDKEKQAAQAARTMFLAGAKLPFPANVVAAPVMGAAAFASMMAFADGGIVPGVGHGDTVPAMLTPGEGVVPGGVMDGLRKMAASGSMGGGTTHNIHVAPVYHLNAIDSEGMDKALQNHSDTIQKHVSNELRKLNR